MAFSLWKYLVLFYNGVFGVSAATLFVFSGIFLYRLFIWRHFIGTTVENPVIVLMLVALLSCFIAWIGYTVILSKHQIHIAVLGVLLTLIVLTEFSCFIWALVINEQLPLEIKVNMHEFFTQSVSMNETSSMYPWDKLQSELECCGVLGPSDYRDHYGGVPWSCCGQGILDSLEAPHTSDCTTVFQRGCAKQVYAHSSKEVFNVAMAALGASLIQSVGVVLTFTFIHVLRMKSAISRTPRISFIRDSSKAEDNSLMESNKYN